MKIIGKGGSQALARAVSISYHDYGLVLAQTADNVSSNSKNILCTAGYYEVIGVGSVDKDNNNPSSFSLTGSDVELVAPCPIRSTWRGGKYAVLSGISMATSFVTGAVALLLGSDENVWKDNDAVNGYRKWYKKPD